MTDKSIVKYHCENYNPDEKFKRFQLLEFPITFVGLATTQELDVELDLTGTSYLRTMCDDTIMTFDRARKLSPSHRAYNIKFQNCHKLKITFKPTHECIARLKMYKQQDLTNKFVVDLRIINVEGFLCCNDETHAEVGRYYLCGQYEICTITHSPNVINFGEIPMKSKVTRSIILRNESQFLAAKISYIKVTGFDVTPTKFCIPPNSSKKLVVSLNPNNLKISQTLTFHVRNPHDVIIESDKCIVTDDTNFLTHTIEVQAKIFIAETKKPKFVESLHKLAYEPYPWNTYLNDELSEHNERQKLAKQLLAFSKSIPKKNLDKEKRCSAKPICYSDCSTPSNFNPLKTGLNFCKDFRSRFCAPDLFTIFLLPQKVDFGRVAVKTYGKFYLTIKNQSTYDVSLKLLHDKHITYTKRNLNEYSVKLPANKEINIILLYFASKVGIYEDKFKYIIDKKFPQEHSYKIRIENPVLFVGENILKFGMATSETFVSSVPVKIYNQFNVPIDFEWENINSDVPFEILPRTGTVPKHDCRICDFIYIAGTSKTKMYEIELTSKGFLSEKISIEAHIITRKLTVKFLQQGLTLKDIPLNIDTVETVRLENGSREIVTFYVMEPLLPGITVIPMSGTMRPKTIMNFQVIFKICCIIEFSYDLFIRVNNKETIVLPVNGNVVEPKLSLSPKNVFMPRVPCGLITYVPLNIHNSGNTRSTLEVLEPEDENACLGGNMFDIFIQEGYVKKKINFLSINPGQSKTLYVKVYDSFRREYDMYLPFRVNGLLGPPLVHVTSSTEFSFYIGEYEKLYESNIKVKVKPVHKDINYVRIIGVFTVPWIEFSVDRFEIEYIPNCENYMDFTMKNVSKYFFHACIVTSKLSPHFTLEATAEDTEFIVTDSYIKFDLDRGRTVSFCLKFHPHGLGKFVTVAFLYLDKAMSLPYSNLLFVGKRELAEMYASTRRIIFPPSRVGTELSTTLNMTLEQPSDLGSFTCSSKEEPHISIELLDCVLLQVGDECHTSITVKIKVCSNITYARNLSIMFCHECGSTICVEVSFCFAHCPLTIHTSLIVPPEENPFPFYALSTQTELYDYLEKTLNFIERWLFQQGFRRELFPVIPDTFHAIGPNMVQQGIKFKGINVSLLNFLKRIAGPLIKHIHKSASYTIEEPTKTVLEMHDTYKSIINLLRMRGANLWLLQAKFLLTHSQFILYTEYMPPVYYADIEFTKTLTKNAELYNRLTKQSWLDFILQCYKVFVLDSCFFDCVCVSSEHRDIEKILVNWYNEQIQIAHKKLLYKIPHKKICNIKTGLQNGIAIICTLFNHCPFLEATLSLVCEVDEEIPLNGIVHNSCIIMEAMNLLRLSFPLTSKDFIEPNFLFMLFLSVHLYIVLPMFQPKEMIKLSPPLLRTSTRTLYINPVSQESLIFNFVILNNHKNSFSVEKIPNENNGKKICVLVKYKASFVAQDKAILLAYGYNKTRIFDTYLVFPLVGDVGSLSPARKCKLSAPIYRPSKVDIAIHSPFAVSAIYKMHITDIEPTVPTTFEEEPKKGFCFKRLRLIENEVYLSGVPKEQTTDVFDHKIYLHLYCLNTQSECSWIWFRSEVGEFFVRVITQPRWDIALDTLQVNVQYWPLDPCSCGEACECYRTLVLMIPHRNDLMLKALRNAMLETCSDVMMHIFDSLVESVTGQVILKMLLAEGDTNMTEVAHILRPENRYRVSSRVLQPRLDHVTLLQYTDAIVPLPATIPPNEKAEKFSIMFVSEDGMDIRTYKILVIEEPVLISSNSSISNSTLK